MNADNPRKPESNPSAVPIPRLDLISTEGQPKQTLPISSSPSEVALLTRQVAELTARLKASQEQEKTLRQEIASLQVQRNLAPEAAPPLPPPVEKLVQEGLKEFEQRKQALQVTIEQLERRQERIRNEMRTTFAGASQDLAIRVQSFKDYLVGSLQDLVTAAEQMELVQTIENTTPAPALAEPDPAQPRSGKPKFTERTYAEEADEIQALIDQYRLEPDYYGPPWQLRRTFEPIHAERVNNWFFTQGGRGALRSMGSRMQNVIVASAIVSILDALYGDQLRVLVLVNSPERMGEWRRGLQDCLGLSRSDFGPDGGVVVFETPDTLIAKADRFQKAGDLPLIIIDETENQINLGLLQFPLWLAFAPDPQATAPVFDW